MEIVSKQPARTFFPQLHVHDEHSIKDGCSTVETYADIVRGLKAKGPRSLALTNHGQAAGYARQYFACKERGIKPIFGMEAYINEHRLSPVREEIQKLRPKGKKKIEDPGVQARLEKLDTFLREKFKRSAHAIILAKSREGYRNLVRMSTDSWVRGFYYAPRTDTKFLAEHAEGLVYSTACIGGYIPRMARSNFDAACVEAKRLQRIFCGDFYVELMITEYSEQRTTNEIMMKLAHEIGAPMIVTCDVHYAKPEDTLAQSTLLLMRDGKTIKDKDAGEGVWQFESKDLWWRSLEDVMRTWREFHSDYMDKETFLGAVRNTYALAEEVEAFDFDTSLKLPGVYENPEGTLKELVAKGLKDRHARGQIPASGKSLRDYVERVQRELQVINVKHFSEYFLVLHDICSHARSIGSRMGPGRGSAGGSLVAYVLRISEIDPLRFNLLFERFLDAGREDPPDIDLDFSPEHRDAIKAYVDKRYPATATIGSFSTFKPRATIQDVARVFGLDHKEVLKITKPMGTDADKLTWDQILELWPQIGEFAEKNERAWHVAQTLRGLISHRSKSASGVLVGPKSALDEVPFMTDPNDTSQVVTAFPDSQGDGIAYKGREITRLGYLKVDILGVQNVNIAPRAAALVEVHLGEKVDVETLPLDDRATFDVATTGDVPGIFQLDSPVARPILQQVGVDSFFDLAIITSLCRPGPLENGLPKRFAMAKRAGAAWKRGVPQSLHDVLAPSRGLMVFQEDVMFTLQRLGGFSMQEANSVRKTIGKKLDPKTLDEYRGKFVEGGRRLGHPVKLLTELFDSLASYARYAFNASHAVAYMITAYRQMFMLTHYPLCYFTALFAETDRGKKQGNQEGEKIVGYMRSAMARGLKILPPHVNLSAIDFDVQGDAIRFGLSKVKGVASAAEAVLATRPYRDLEDFVERVDGRRVNSRIVTSLIRAGALDDLSFDPSAGDEVIPEGEGVERRNALLLRYHQLRRTKPEKLPDAMTTLGLLEQERDLLGLTLSFWASTEKDRLREELGLETIAYSVQEGMRRLSLLGEITRLRLHETKRGRMAFLSLADETGTLDNIVVWADKFKRYRDRLGKPGNLVVIHLERKESRDRSYGEWTYFLDERLRGQEPVENALRAMRREL